MGKVISPFQIRGRFNDLVISGGGPNGTSRAYIFIPHNRKKWLKENPTSAARRSVIAFAAASKVGSAIMRPLLREVNLRPYAQNHLNSLLFRNIHDNISWADTHLPLHKAIHGLIGAELGHQSAPSNSIRIMPIGPHHRPDALHLHGLQQAARRVSDGSLRACPEHSRRGLQCRITIHRLTVPLAHRGSDHDNCCHIDRKAWKIANHRTEWFGADLIPDTGIRMDMPQPTEATLKGLWPDALTSGIVPPTLVVVSVEWRRLRKRAKPLLLKTSTTVRITGLHIPDNSPEKQDLLGPETSLLLAAQARPKRRYRLPKPLRTHARTHTRTQTQTPHQLLEKAIGTRQRT